MAIRTDSYSNIDGIVAATRHMLDGQSTFNTTTIPTLVEVTSFVDEASGIMNSSLAGAGFTVPVTNTTAKLSLDSWVRWRSVEYVQLTQQRGGFAGELTGTMEGLGKEADEFVDANILGFKRLGVGVSYQSSDGLAFTGIDKRSERDDPDSSTKEQPLFRRRQFDAP